MTLPESTPLPLAQLARRARDGTSSVERHNCAYFLGEAALKLAAAIRIRMLLELPLEQGERVTRRLVCLKLPSLGKWCELLRAVNEELGRLPDAPARPLARSFRQLAARRSQWDAVARFATRAAEVGVVSRDASRRGSAGGVVGFFELLTVYRNEVIGHGAQRSDAYCSEFAGLLLDAMMELLRCEPLFDGLEMARAVPRLDDGGALVWRRLSGLSPRTTQEICTGADPGQLYFVSEGLRISVHPLVVVRDDQLGREQVGFLNRTVLRSRPIAGGLIEEVRRVDYLDYASGDTFSAIDTRDGMTELLARSRAAAEGSAQEPGAPDVIGDFELQGELGRGGAGIVYEARQRSMGRTVALKVVQPLGGATATQLRRFHREIAALARCDHANVVKVLTAGAEGGRHFFAMDFVDGADLARVGRVLARWRDGGLRLRAGHLEGAVAEAARPRFAGADPAIEPARPPLPAPQGSSLELRLAALFADAAHGLTHLHLRGTVHRDIKPSNLMLTSDATRLVIMDLGAAHLSDASASATRSGFGLAGTLRYMAPEQLQREHGEVDERADVYALGATLFELLTGRPLFDGNTEARLVQQVLYEEPRPARSLVSSVPRALSDVVLVATSKRPEDRYPSAAALADDLRAVVEDRPIRARPPGSGRRLALFARRHRALSAVAIVTMAMGGGVAAWAWAQTRPRTGLFAYCVEPRGSFAGIQALDTARGRSRACQLTVERGRVVRVFWVDGRGRPVVSDTGDAEVELVYSDRGEVLERIHRGRDGRVRQKHRLAWERGTLHATVVDRDNVRVSLDGSDVSMYRVVFDARGFPRQVTFFSDRGAPRPDVEMAYGYELETTADGLLSRKLALAQDGSATVTRSGVTSLRITRDANGDAREQSNHDASGALREDASGVATTRWGLDEFGNGVEELRQNAQGQPVPGPDGCAGWRAERDEAGSVLAWTCVGQDGNPGWHRDGFVTRRRSYDERGNTVEEAMMDAAGAPVASLDGCPRWRARYDATGRRIEQSFLLADGGPCQNRDGYVTWRAVHDDDGHVIRASYFDQAGHPVLHRDGVASFASKYDARGNLIESSYYGLDGDLIRNRYGYARRTWHYDEQGNLERIAYYGPGGEPCAGLDGYATWRARYDDRGRRTEQWYLDALGQPAKDARDGAYGVRARYDELGREIERSWLGADSAPAAAADGVVRERLHYDAHHQLVRREGLNGAGQVVAVTRVDVRAAEASARTAVAVRVREQLPQGVVVAGVRELVGGAGPRFRTGDVLVALEGQPVHDAREVWWFERSRQQRPAVARVIRHGTVVDVLVAERALGIEPLE